MASHKNYQVNRNKSSRGINIFEKGRNRRKTATKSERMMQGIAIWASFYRANPHRFVKDYLGIELKLFQQIILWAMMHFHFVTYIASRGQLALPIGNFRVIKLGEFGGHLNVKDVDNTEPSDMN